MAHFLQQGYTLSNNTYSATPYEIMGTSYIQLPQMVKITVLAKDLVEVLKEHRNRLLKHVKRMSKTGLV